MYDFLKPIYSCALEITILYNLLALKSKASRWAIGVSIRLMK